jgi:prepilin-type N-terminal cleavage/methylation domain-containing protein
MPAQRPLSCIGFSPHPHRRRGGFTLIEILLVLGIISVLTSILLIAINPSKQLGRANDTKRQSDINTILNAVYQYQVDTNVMPNGIPTAGPLFICKDTAASCGNGVNLGVLTASGKYLVHVPTDPQAPATGTGTNYTIQQDHNGRITVTAPGAEQTGAISVTR